MKIAIIGGGFSGICLLHMLSEKYLEKENVQVVIFEKTESLLFRGIAYENIPNRDDRLNVQANKMGIHPDNPEDFFYWLQKYYPNKYLATDYVSRNIYGHYLEHKARSVSEKFYKIINDEIIDIDNLKNVYLKSGIVDRYDKVFLCSGINPQKNINLDSFLGLPQVVIKGTGLSAIDHIIELNKKNFKGEIIAFSRHGLLPLPQESLNLNNLVEFKIPNRLIDLFIQIRKYHLETSRTEELIAFLRPSIPEIWNKFSSKEKRQFRKYLRPYWEVLRHRMPLVHSVIIDELIKSKKLKILKLKNLPKELLTNAMIDSTGFNPIDEFPLVQNLLKRNLIKKDEFGWGIKTYDNYVYDKWLFAPGALGRYDFYEVTAVKEIRESLYNLVRSL